MRRINLSVSDEMYALIKSSSEKRALNMNAVIIVALEEYFSEVTSQINSMRNMFTIDQIRDMLEELENEEKERNDPE